MGRFIRQWFAAIVVLGLASPFAGAADTEGTPLRYRIVAEHPHETTAFTEGLLIEGGLRLESTGLYGRSELIASELKSGRRVRAVALSAQEFGEGLALAGDRLFQLTWREGRCHVYDLKFRRVAEFGYAGEGWGLAYDGRDLIRSDGSATLHFHDPATFTERRQLQVTDRGMPVPRLNELEVIDGLIYANVWMSERIAVIDPASGVVRHWLDLAGLVDRMMPPRGWNPREDVLNGIAYDANSKRLWVTGKRWPSIFEIELLGAGSAE